jgi:hypothetical protein
MPQISTQEFERLPLRVHDFLAGVPLHDVWAVDLPRARSGITLDEFLRTAARPCPPPALVRALLNIRLFVGRRLGWDREPAPTAWETFATRLTTADRSRSLAPFSGTGRGRPCGRWPGQAGRSADGRRSQGASRRHVVAERNRPSNPGPAANAAWPARRRG